MPRITRAALRSHALLEDADLAASTPLPLTPRTRVPLGEIAGNKEEVAAVVIEPLEILKVEKKLPAKGKRGRIAKNAKKQENCEIEDPVVEVLEDATQSPISSAVDDACQDLMQENTGDIHQIVMHDQRPHTPPSRAVNAVKVQIKSIAQTPKFDPNIHKSENNASADANENQEDSFTETIHTRTPANMAHSGSSDGTSSIGEFPDGVQKEKDDSFAEQIMKMSPVKKVSHIEDSVEAIDAFEEAIEKVGELIPAISSGPLPGRTKKQINATKFPDGSKVATRMSNRNTSAGAKTSSTSSSEVAKPTKITRKRVSSIHKAPFQPTKSTKPPTRPSFELPGDAISRKLKEQREERLKRREVDAPAKPVFKARPVRRSQAPVVKATATSKARMSLAQSFPSDASTATDHAPRSKTAARPGSMAFADPNKRLSTLSVAKRPTRISADMSARGIRDSLSTATAPARKSSIMGAPPRLPTTAPDLAQQKLRGKEVFNRTRVEQDERDRLKKEKEEAARKARVEAAERGRLASREWAEKQKLKKMANPGNGAEGAGVKA